jgi:hypothetical protein
MAELSGSTNPHSPIRQLMENGDSSTGKTNNDDLYSGGLFQDTDQNG